MFTELLKTIGVSVITNGVVLALFIWVFKKIFEKALDQRMKLDIKALELRHKKSFHRFSKMFDEQAVVLRDIYLQLIELNDLSAYLAYKYQLNQTYPELLERFRMPETGNPHEWERYLKNTLSENPEEKRSDLLVGAATKALRDFRPRRIYLSPTVANEVERLINLFLFVGSEFKNVNYRDPHTLEQVIAPEVIAAWKQAIHASQAIFPQLEEQFRFHLGHGSSDA